MATANRAALLTKTHKVLKKHYTAPPVHSRPLLEELLFSCCLENATHAQAEQAFQMLQESYFDWNEVRVSTLRELSEALSMLPDPVGTGVSLKRVLQAVFDKTYSFNLDLLQKQALGKAVKEIETTTSASPFALARVTQSVLGGHAIPLDKGSLEVLRIVGALTEPEIAKGSFGAVERAIPKTKGAEFSGLLHEAGAAFQADPHSPALHKILIEISSDSKQRLPQPPPPADAPVNGEASPTSKRSSRKSKPPAATEAPPPPAPKKSSPKKSPPKSKPKTSPPKSKSKKSTRSKPR